MGCVQSACCERCVDAVNSKCTCCHLECVINQFCCCEVGCFACRRRPRAGSKDYTPGSPTGYRPVPPSSESEAVHSAKGSRMNMYKQDPSVHAMGYRPVWVADRVYSGPRNGEIEVETSRRSYPDRDDNFLYDPSTDPVRFDAAHTFAVVHRTLSMYRRALKRMKSSFQLDWYGGRTLRVHPRAGYKKNAYYSRNEMTLRFFYFNDDRTGQRITICRSFDIVAHECGHAILDGLRPHYNESKKHQTSAFHEAFGDLTAIFSLLDQLDVCEAIVSLSKGDLHERNFLSIIGEEFGSSLGLGLGIRNADNNMTLDDASKSVHDLSRVLSGAVYDILIDIYEYLLDLSSDNPAETLYKAAKHLTSVFVAAILNAPAYHVSFSDIAKEMLNAEKSSSVRKFMEREFIKRKILGRRDNTRHMTEEEVVLGDLASCCGTMTLPFDGDERNDVFSAIQQQEKDDAETRAHDEVDQTQVEEDAQQQEIPDANQQKQETVQMQIHIEQRPTTDV